MRWRVPAFVWALGVAGCGVLDEPPPRAPGALFGVRARPEDPPRRKAPTRPSLRGATVDLGAIASLEPAPSATASASGAFEIVRTTRDDACASTWSQPGAELRSSLPFHTVLDLGGARLPGPALDGTFRQLDAALDEGEVQGDVPSTWSTISAAGEDAQHVVFTRYEGVFARATGRGTPTRAASARALRLGSSGTYVFRRCARGCEGPEAAREDELVVLGPPPIWTSSSEIPASDRSLTDPNLPFSLLVLPITEGKASTVTLIYEHAAAGALRDRKPMQLSRWWEGEVWVDFVVVDLVWSAGDAPECTVHTGDRVTSMESIGPALPPAPPRCQLGL